MTQLPPHIQQEIEKNFPFGSDATTRLFVNIIAEHAYLAGQDSERERVMEMVESIKKDQNYINNLLQALSEAEGSKEGK